MGELQRLRIYLIERHGHRCCWPVTCTSTDSIQLAHLSSRGAHPDLKYDINNLLLLCKYHHDILDGRVVHGRRYEMADLLRYALDRPVLSEPSLPPVEDGSLNLDVRSKA
jgi:hypothetical protein